MSSECIMEFIAYEVPEITFKKNIVQKDQGEIELKPKFTRTIADDKDGRFSVSLSFELVNEDNNQLPFDIKVIIVGYFHLECDEEERKTLMEKNTVAILYPYLRALITSLTASANVPPLVIPVINVVKMFDKD